MWVRRELRVPDLEAWHEFRDRVKRGFAKITDGAGSKKRAVAFSSAGPVAAAMGLALNLGDEETSTKLDDPQYCVLGIPVFTRTIFSLVAFNAVHHLAERRC